jgi:tellurite resistance protein
MVDYHTALVYTMVLVSAADGDMTDKELIRIGETIEYLPIFADYDDSQLTKTAAACADILSGADGLERALDQILTGLPAKLAETAYVLACDVAAADGKVQQEESRLLEMLRDRLQLDRLAAAAIERAARARYQTL